MAAGPIIFVVFVLVGSLAGVFLELHSCICVGSKIRKEDMISIDDALVDKQDNLDKDLNHNIYPYVSARNPNPITGPLATNSSAHNGGRRSSGFLFPGDISLKIRTMPSEPEQICHKCVMRNLERKFPEDMHDLLV